MSKKKKEHKISAGKVPPPPSPKVTKAEFCDTNKTINLHYDMGVCGTVNFQVNDMFSAFDNFFNEENYLNNINEIEKRMRNFHNDLDRRLDKIIEDYKNGF